jgi:hypothetical protein
MAIDEAGRDDEALRVQRPRGRRPNAPDLDDPTSRDTHIAAIAGGPRAIDDRSLANDQIKGHGVLSSSNE